MKRSIPAPLSCPEPAVKQPVGEAVLEVVYAGGACQSVPVDHSPFRIGANRAGEHDNHLDLSSDQRISRHSAAVICSDGEFRVEDAGQRLGIFVNGEKVESRALHEGDVITLGAADSLRLIFHCEGATADAIPGLLSRLDQAASQESGARELQQLSVLLEATALLQAHLPVREVLAAMLDRAIEVTDAERGLLLESDATGDFLPVIARKQGRQSLPVEGIVLSRKVIDQLLRIKGHSEAADPDSASSVVIQQRQTAVAIPLFTTQRRSGETTTSASGVPLVLGVLYLDSCRVRAFSHLQHKILDALATEAASVLDSARLVKRERERRKLVQELSIAREIQQALLPRSFGRHAHLEVTGANRPCLAVGGDYFDLLELAPDRTGFVIADVCGKGLSAALLTGMLQFAFSGIALGQAAPLVFHNINRFLCTHAEVRRSATIFFGAIDRTGQLEFVNAGHIPPLLIRDGQVGVVSEAGSWPVGFFQSAQYETHRASLQPGDTVILITDGITEAVNPAEELFGPERLLRSVERHAGKPVDELQASILADVEEFSRGAHQADDITLLVVRYLGHRSG